MSSKDFLNNNIVESRKSDSLVKKNDFNLNRRNSSKVSDINNSCHKSKKMEHLKMKI